MNKTRAALYVHTKRIDDTLIEVSSDLLSVYNNIQDENQEILKNALRKLAIIGEVNQTMFLLAKDIDNVNKNTLLQFANLPMLEAAKYRQEDFDTSEVEFKSGRITNKQKSADSANKETIDTLTSLDDLLEYLEKVVEGAKIKIKIKIKEV